MRLVHLNSMRGFDQFFNSVAGSAVANAPAANSTWQPSVDIREGKDSYSIALDVPAVEQNDIDVAVKEGVLTVAGERVAEAVETDTKVHRLERRAGKFARSFTLPEDADAHSIEATAKAGVLTIRIGKRAEATPVSITVKVARGKAAGNQAARSSMQ